MKKEFLAAAAARKVGGDESLLCRCGGSSGVGFCPSVLCQGAVGSISPPAPHPPFGLLLAFLKERIQGKNSYSVHKRWSSVWGTTPVNGAQMRNPRETLKWHAGPDVRS